MKPSARPALLGEIQHKGVTSEIATGVTLKKAETVDKSGPVIEGARRSFDVVVVFVLLAGDAGMRLLTWCEQRE